MVVHLFIAPHFVCRVRRSLITVSMSIDLSKSVTLRRTPLNCNQRLRVTYSEALPGFTKYLDGVTHHSGFREHDDITAFLEDEEF